MALSAGARLGAYEVIGPLGAGGMGEVYRARDTRLHRDVAIKILPDVFANDPDRLARFQREAHVLAALNHPHIAQIHGLEEQPPALVMELVEGETLADRISRGPIAVDEAVAMAKQIAEALAAAHEQGIIHRDLKPANVRLTPSGSVKVLDFGLAKLADGRAANAGPYGAYDDRGVRLQADLSPTITSPVLATGVGMLLGTAVYMAPEQAKGRVADKRADVWAFGCVLFEMLTARRAFDGEGVTETLAAVLMKEPDWSALPADVPPHVQRVLRRCLRKDPRQRIQDLGDARLDLEDALPDVAAGATPIAIAPTRRSWVPWTAAGVLLLALPVVWWMAQPPATDAALVKFGVIPPPGLRFNDGAGAATLTPDGRSMVLALREGTTQQLFIRPLDQLEAKPIAGAEGSRPFFSPDGLALGFTQSGSLYRIAVGGGAPLKIADRIFGPGTWGPDGTIVFTPTYASGLWRVPANGGMPEKLTEPNSAAGELGHWYPQFLPGGRAILFTLFRTPADTSSIAVYSLDTKQTTVVATNGFFARYAVSGQLLYTRSATVMAVNFDLSTLKTIGSPVPVIEGVATSPQNGEAQYAVSPNGTLAYITAAAFNPPRQLATISADGKVEAATGPLGNYNGLVASPDGRRLAFEREDPEPDIWLFDTTRDVFTRLTSMPGSDINATWTADGRRIIFSHEEPVFHLYWRGVDDNLPPERLLDGPEDQIASSVTPDGKFLIFSQSSATTRGDLWMLPLAGDRTPQLLLRTPSSEAAGTVSADGKWLAYLSDDTGRDEIYVQSFPDGKQRTQVSTGGGRVPRWSRTGTTLFYRDADKVLSVTVTASPDLELSKPQVRFEAPLHGTFDTAPDNTFFAVLRDPTGRPTPATVVLNWFGELRRAVSPK